MARKLKSPTRTISNRGDYPRFIGNFPCTKAAESFLPFDSLSALFCGIWLEYRKDIIKIQFEPRKFSFPATDTLPAIELIPDYMCVMDTGEIRFVEAKYSRVDLTQEEVDKLKWAELHFQNQGSVYEVVYRKDLEESGFVQTILLLRPYAQLGTPESTLTRAFERLRGFQPSTLTVWRARARELGVNIGVLYQLLYQQRLGFTPEPLSIIEISQWLA